MNEKDILNFIQYKKDKDFEKLENKFLPTYELFVAISEKYVFNGDFSEEMLKIRNFCIMNYLRMIFCEVEYRVQINEFSQEILNAEYSKLSDRTKTFKKDIKKILNFAKQSDKR